MGHKGKEKTEKIKSKKAKNALKGIIFWRVISIKEMSVEI